MRCRLVLAIGLATFVATGLGAPGAAARPPGPPGARGLVARHAERLGLDERTRSEIERIAEASEARERELRERIRAARDRMHDLLSRPEVDHEAVTQQSEALSALHAESSRNRLDAILRIHDLLTPAQRRALAALRAEEGPRWHRRGPLGRCGWDLSALCGNADPGPAALRCLADRWAEVSDRCRDAVEGREGPPPGPPPEAMEP